MIDSLIITPNTLMKNLLFLLLFPAMSLAQNAVPTDTLVYNSRRAVTLEGASNFRDLGGYPAAGGKTVKWGHIYRSADISKLTDADLKTLESKHIATICDLRGPDEVKNHPDRIPASVTYLNLPAGSEKVQLKQASLPQTGTSLDSTAGTGYARTDHLKAKYKPMFDQLLMLDGTKALMFHCTGGRDRTGIGAALILSALGVEKAIVLKDYVATDVYLKPAQIAWIAEQMSMSAAEMTKRIAMKPADLDKFFTAVNQKYGSMDNFLTTEMELTPAKMATLRAKYLN
jgi:protein-tyrosine phosphatase